MQFLLEFDVPFQFFGRQHLVLLGLTALGCAGAPALLLRIPSQKKRLAVLRVLSSLLAATVVAWIGMRLWLGEFDHTTDLPLDICNLAALALPAVAWRPRLKIHEVLFFWVCVGTLQATLTPHLEEGFPHFTFLKYWVVHGGLLVAIVSYTVVFGLYPNRRSILRAFGWLQVYAVSVYLANLALGSNYFYIMQKPPTASLLDHLGPWPWYILVAEGLTLLLFALVYVPVSGRASRASVTS